jgi:hypothetical protein
MLREIGDPCPQCQGAGGRVNSRQPLYAPVPATFGSGDRTRKERTATRYTCDRDHNWEERFSPSE